MHLPFGLPSHLSSLLPFLSNITNNATERYTQVTKVFWMKTSTCRDGTLKNQPNYMAMTLQHFHTIQCRRQVGGGGRGATGGSLPRAPSVRGPPNSMEIRSGSSFTSQSSFFKRFVSLYCWFQVSLTLLTQTSNECTLYLAWLLRSHWLGPRTWYFSIWNC